MDQTSKAAWRIAAGYAVILALIIGPRVVAIATQSPEAWRKAVGLSVVGLATASIPFIALKAAARFVATPCHRRAVAWVVIAACALPVVAAAALSFSSEPLAMLALLYVPPVQALALALFIAGAALPSRRP